MTPGWMLKINLQRLRLINKWITDNNLKWLHDRWPGLQNRNVLFTHNLNWRTLEGSNGRDEVTQTERDHSKVPTVDRPKLFLSDCKLERRVIFYGLYTDREKKVNLFTIVKEYRFDHMCIRHVRLLSIFNKSHVKNMIEKSFNLEVHA